MTAMPMRESDKDLATSMYIAGAKIIVPFSSKRSAGSQIGDLKDIGLHGTGATAGLPSSVFKWGTAGQASSGTQAAIPAA